MTIGMTATTLDLSNVTYAAMASVSSTVTETALTAASDSFVITGTTGADTITASSLGDTITGGAGADTITGGAGADTINFITEATSSIYDTVVGAATDDIIDFNTADNGTSVWTSEKVAFNTDIATTLAAAVAGDGSSNSTYKWFTDGTDSYVAIDKSADATFVNGTDALIKIAGVTDLSGATFDEAAQTLTFA